MAHETVLFPRDPVCREAIALFLDAVAAEGVFPVRIGESGENDVRLDEADDMREITLLWETADGDEEEFPEESGGGEGPEELFPEFSLVTLSVLEETLKALARNVEAAGFFVRRFRRGGGKKHPRGSSLNVEE